MSEWTSVLAVFWVLWALDGARVGKRRAFTLVGDTRGRRGRVAYGRLSLPGLAPTSWRATTPDVPLALSPVGLCNVPVGSAGRPAETPLQVLAWRWDEVRDVGVAEGWIFVNGTRFCPDTGHVSARELLALAQLAPARREARIHAFLGRWFRPAHLRRRACVLVGRTSLVATLNMIAVAVFAALTIYVLGDFAERLAPRTSHAIATVLPWVVLAVLVVHAAAVIAASRAGRTLRPVIAQKRGAALFSAALMPPQALRLRALLGEGFFPAQHPLALVVAFGKPRARARAAFATLADLRWPVPLPPPTSPLADEITTWFGGALEAHVQRLLTESGLAAGALLAPPRPDGPASCQYCPRCQDQFVAGPRVCPHGVRLEPLPGRGD